MSAKANWEMIEVRNLCFSTRNACNKFVPIASNKQIDAGASQAALKVSHLISNCLITSWTAKLVIDMY